MKNKLAILALILTIQFTVAQNFQTVEEVNDACSQLGFMGNEDAEIAVDNILDIIGVFRNFTIQECPDINNAVAKIIETASGNKERYILYDSEFFKRIDDKAANDWAAVSILAHEISHHLNGHALNNKGSNHKFELEADYSSGYYLGRMGATLEEAQSAIQTFRYEKATSTHPAKADRLNAIKRGWSKATGKVVIKTIEEKEIKAFDYYRKGELAFADYQFEKARNYFEDAEKLGYVDANYYLSYIHRVGLGVYVDTDKAYKYAEMGYSLGSIPTAYQLGKFLSEGIGVEKNSEDANRLFQKNFQINWFKEKYKKYNTAYYATAIGDMYQSGYGGVKEDYEKAVYWYKLAAKGGDLEGQNALAYMLVLGNGVDKDFDKALYWIKKSANLGYSGSLNNLGYMYKHGYGVEKDYSQAIYWYKKAVKIGCDSAQSNLGYMYKHGYGVEINYSLAVELFKKSANQGSETGKYYLGKMYLEGKGVSKDYDKAMYWIKKAAKQGEEDAQKRLTNLGETW